MSETTAEDLSWLAEWCERIRRAVANAGDRETVRKVARIAASLRADLEAAEERAQKAEARVKQLEGLSGVHPMAERAYAEKVLRGLAKKWVWLTCGTLEAEADRIKAGKA